MRSSPVTVLLVVAATGLGLAVLAMLLATQQNWLGLKLVADLDSGHIVVSEIYAGGPSSALTPGFVLERITGEDGPSIALSATDLTEEADAVDSFAAYDRFMDRQEVIAAILGSQDVTLEFANGTIETVIPAASRPLSTLPINFWIQLGVAFSALMIGGAVRALKPGNTGSALLLVCGVAYVVSAFPSAIYMTRELALPELLFRTLNIINSTGSSAFTVTMLVLFLTYPRRLVSRNVLFGIAAVFAVWQALDFLQIVLPGPHMGRYMVVAVTLFGAILLAILQYVLARDDPRMRAAVAWAGLSLAVAASIHTIMFTVPVMLGQQLDYTQTFAYALGLILYAGLALSIIRYRLFDIDRLGFLILFYAAGALLLLLLDGTIILLFSVNQRTAFGVSLLILALVYLPARQFIWHLISRRRPVDEHKMFASVLDLAFEPSAVRRQSLWTDLLRQLFDPLHIDKASGKPDTTTIAQEGVEMTVPATAELPAITLRYPRRGRGLFSSRHRQVAEDLVDFVEKAETGRNAYELGVADERTRISRDMHDNIGAQLLSALHSPAVERKNQMIGQSLSDLRDIVRNATRADMPMEEMVADLRAECAERLAPTSIQFDWHSKLDENTTLSTACSHALRSILREAISNVMRHSGAASVRISLLTTEGEITLEVVDDGQGFEPDAHQSSTGIKGMRARTEGLGGSLRVEATPTGTKLTAQLPALAKTELA